MKRDLQKRPKYIWKETYKRDLCIHEKRHIKETSVYMKRNLQREEYVYAEYVCVYAWKFTLNKNVSQYNFIYYRYTHVCIRKIHIRIRLNEHMSIFNKNVSIYLCILQVYAQYMAKYMRASIYKSTCNSIYSYM